MGTAKYWYCPHEYMILTENIHHLGDIIRPFSLYLPLTYHHKAD